MSRNGKASAAKSWELLEANLPSDTSFSLRPDLPRWPQAFKIETGLQARNHQIVSVIFRSTTCLLLTTDYRVLNANNITSAAPPETAGAPQFRVLAAAMSKFIR